MTQLKKIALIGSMNCGKTTTLHYLSYKLPNIGIGYETARECPYPLDEKAGLLTQLWILFKQIEREAKLEKFHDRIILDRSVYDSVIYCEYLVSKGIMNFRDYAFARNVAVEWGRKHPYTLLVYLDPLPFKDSFIPQIEIDKRFKKFLMQEVSYPHIMIPVGPRNERCKKIYRIVKKWLA